MATTPTYASTPRIGHVQLANADSTNQSGDIIAGVAAGTRVSEIRVYSGPTTAPGTGVLTLQLYDGTSSRVFEVLTLTNTANLQQAVFRYDNLILPSSSWKIRAQMRTAITSGGTIDIVVLGADLT